MSTQLSQTVRENIHKRVVEIFVKYKAKPIPIPIATPTPMNAVF
jgi:hypothetical protein